MKGREREKLRRGDKGKKGERRERRGAGRIEKDHCNFWSLKYLLPLWYFGEISEL